MKKTFFTGLFLVVIGSSLHGQDRSSATQVVTFGVKKSTAQVAAVLANTMSPAPSRHSQELAFTPLPASTKKVTYQFDGELSGGATFSNVSAATSRSPLTSRLVNAREVVVTVTD